MRNAYVHNGNERKGKKRIIIIKHVTNDHLTKTEQQILLFFLLRKQRRRDDLPSDLKHAHAAGYLLRLPGQREADVNKMRSNWLRRVAAVTLYI